MNTGRCNCGCNGERIMVNNCGCRNNRSNAVCANTFRPTSGCGCRREERCECRREEDRCGRHRPCPSCEDRCRRQYRECMRKCRCQDEERCDCRRLKPCRSHHGYENDNSYEEE